jgi:hypothetical protein
VRGDELAVDVDVFDALHVGFLFAPVLAAVRRSLGVHYCAYKPSYDG